MSIRIKHCLVIACDGCGEIAGDEETGSELHFADLDGATAALAGDGDDEDYTHEWLMTPTEHVCPRCRAKRACATIGHDWGDWWASEARGLPVARRYCWRCDEHEIGQEVTAR